MEGLPATNEISASSLSAGYLSSTNMPATKMPGMPRTALTMADKSSPIKSLDSIPSVFNRRVILLATASITDENIFSNGLYQNVFVIYKMAEVLGWLPIYIVNSKPTDLSVVPEILRKSRIATIEDICNEVIWLNNGKLMARGKPTEVIAAYREFVDARKSASSDEDV